MAKKKVKKLKPRNYAAIAAITKTGAGRHKDKKKEASKKACRRRIDHG
jgi:hypothetical protein